MPRRPSPPTWGVNNGAWHRYSPLAAFALLDVEAAEDVPKAADVLLLVVHDPLHDFLGGLVGEGEGLSLVRG